MGRVHCRSLSWLANTAKATSSMFSVPSLLIIVCNVKMSWMQAKGKIALLNETLSMVILSNSTHYISNHFGVNITLSHAQHSDIAIWLDAAFSNICMLPRRCVMNDVTTPDSLFWMIWRWLAASILPERLSATNRSFPWKLFLKACRKLFLASAATSVAEGIIAAPPLGATWHFMND